MSGLLSGKQWLTLGKRVSDLLKDISRKKMSLKSWGSSVIDQAWQSWECNLIRSITEI